MNNHESNPTIQGFDFQKNYKELQAGVNRYMIVLYRIRFLKKKQLKNHQQITKQLNHFLN